MSGDLADLTSFLLEAKRRTYAGLDDDATFAMPLLMGSKQLEYAAWPYAYRDIYFGMAFFAGQETVAKDGRVIWSMSYAGGLNNDVIDRETVLSVYKFLRKALLVAPADAPYRGPPSYRDGEMSYGNAVEGPLDAFHGVETISRAGQALYRLHYAGGLLR